MSESTEIGPHPQDVGQNDFEDERSKELVDRFPNIWRYATADNRLSLFGFRRFRTIHLLNLRFLEAEVEKIDRKIFQAGLKLGIEPTDTDKLGLRHSKLDENSPESEEIIKPELILQLRALLNEYGTQESYECKYI
jgi:hypothetical protein